MGKPDGLNWQPKELAVYLPLTATSIAVAWQVGRLRPSGAFTLFTLSDHLVAAMDALPVALAMVAFFSLSFAMLTSVSKFLGDVARPRLAAALYVLTVLGAVIVLRWSGGPLQTSDYVVLGGIALFFANTLMSGFSLTSPAGLTFLFGLAIVSSLTLSADMTERTIARVDAGQIATSTIQTKKSGAFNGYILMTGERGVLAYMPETHRFRFTPTDDLQGIAK